MARILVVDDEPRMLKTLRVLLQEEGHQISTARSVGEAIDLIDQGEGFELVITDLIMPGRSGLDLIEHITRTSPRTRFIVMTGKPTERTASEADRRGIAEYLIKPVSFPDLTLAIARVLGTEPEDSA